MSTGEVVGGRYRLEAWLSTGASGQLWLATDQQLNRQVAVRKLLLDPRDPYAAERASQEARRAGEVSSPYAVAVLDLVFGPDGPALVSEYAPGVTLAQRISEAGPLPVEQASRIVGQVAAALAAAHAVGVPHGDVTPLNIVLGPDGDARLTDFGAPRPQAWAPNDLWSLGATLSAAVQGAPPGPGRQPIHDERLEGLLVRLLDADPGRRPTAAQVVAELTPDLMTADQSQGRRNVLLAVLAVLAALIVFGGGVAGVLALTSGSDDTEGATSPRASASAEGDLVLLEAEGFSIRLPGRAKATEEMIPTAVGPIPSTLYVVDNGADAFVAALITYPESYGVDLPGAVQGIAKSYGGTVLGTRSTEIKGQPALRAEIEATIQGRDFRFFALAVDVDDKLFQLIQAVEGTAPSEPPAIFEKVVDTLTFD